MRALSKTGIIVSILSAVFAAASPSSASVTLRRSSPSIEHQLVGSAKHVLLLSERAFSSASSVEITGYVHDGKTIEDLNLALLSDGDGSYSFTIKRARAQLMIVGGAAYFQANMAYLETYDKLSAAQASADANTWLQEGSLNTARLTSDLNFNAILGSIVHIGGKLTRTRNRRLNDVPVGGVHSSTSGYVYVSTTRIPYPVEFQYQKKGLHELLRFSGWNAQLEPVAPATDIKVGASESYNWSGYVLPASPGTVTQVDASWIEPRAICSSSGSSFSSAWIGIDGESDSRVFQVGTEADCLNGGQRDHAWFENYPSPPNTLPISVNPGDTMSADIRESSPGYWNYTLTDVTTGQVSNSSSPIAYKGPGNSVEWIEEDPGDNSNVLTDFGTVSFSGLAVNGVAPTLDLTDNAVNMVQRGKQLDQTSQFEANAFTVVFQ